MKKMIFVPVIACLLLAVSCKKPHTCTCTDQYGGSVNATIDGNRKTAQAHCDNMQNTYGSGYTCALD